MKDARMEEIVKSHNCAPVSRAVVIGAMYTDIDNDYCSAYLLAGIGPLLLRAVIVSWYSP